MKTCTKCGETKSLSEFGKNAGGRDGLRSKCKACCNIVSAAWFAKNRDQRNATSAKWQAANQERKKASNAKWRESNIEKMRAYEAKWRAENPESIRIKNNNRRALKRKNGGKLSSGLSAKLFDLQRGMCACGCKQPLGDRYHLDHIMPLALGGSNTDDNMQLLRSTCNQQKHAKHPVEFMQQRGFLL